MGINVLSLFDGMSVAQQALKECGIEVENYFASEIDKYSIATTQANFPNTIQLGDVKEIENVWKKFGMKPNIDLLIGGSPCQDLSIAGKRVGLGGERSGLFYEYLRIRDEIRPKYFVLENVNSMPKEAKAEISKCLGVEPIMINASLVSAQNRKRLFWIGKLNEKTSRYEQVNIELPEDRNILLKDILETDVDEKYYINKPLNKVVVRKYKVDIENLKNILREHKTISNKEISKILNKPLTLIEHWFRSDNSFAIPSKDVWLNLKELLNIKTDEFDKSIMEFQIKDNVYEIAERVNKIDKKSPTISTSGIIRIGSLNSGGQGDRIYSTDGKSVNLSAGGGRGAKTGLYKQENKIRKLTPIECLRLQSMPDNYFEKAICDKKPISNTQKYKMCGNAFNCEVIKHIINNLK